MKKEIIDSDLIIIAVREFFKTNKNMDKTSFERIIKGLKKVINGIKRLHTKI